MIKFKEILLDVWREACRNIEITKAVPVIAGMLVRHIPLDQILIVQFKKAQLTLEMVAVGFVQNMPEDRRNWNCSKKDGTAIGAWHRNGDVHHRAAESDSVIASLLPFETDADILAGPLKQQGEYSPFLIMIAGASTTFEPRHVAMMRVLLEPMGIALENDTRLKEMVQLREVAEADRKTLLAKLSRKEIGDVIIGAEKGLKSVMDRIAIVAGSDLPVLIFGETGTGKELVSREIHNKSNRFEGPFIRVNCGAIPSELIDSQLFGHEKGAFTGAVENRKGWFERADGGTLFLDEVGEMPLKAQVRLLRILQDGWLERVGGKNAIKVDVRIVLATHRDLAAMVAQRTFRDDLWYRIATFPIYLPALRERREDMRELASHFAKRSAIRFGLPEIMPTEADIQILTSYNWPGNIRELGTVIDRAALLGNGGRLEIAKALGWSGSFTDVKSIPAASSLEEESLSTKLSLDQVMKRHIESVLTRTRGRIDGKFGAAVILKINPHTLRARMRKLGIDWVKFRDA
ncbi:MAG: sigma-54 dependent transcriptional regulator [candidate division KSB1 bacterium]|jgi:transcriptional regulator with GAF, ATPase, and Fis domain|nr:sigma-54 dependent transcriptional regulator [candidate division KSB1 bacterium]